MINQSINHFGDHSIESLSDLLELFLVVDVRARLHSTIVIDDVAVEDEQQLHVYYYCQCVLVRCLVYEDEDVPMAYCSSER